MNDTTAPGPKTWVIDPEDTTPIWFLDIDGVVNAFPIGPVEGVLRGYATPGEGWQQFPITWYPDVVERMRDLHDSGRVRLVWLTTWGVGANLEFRKLVGLPQLEVIRDPAMLEPDQLNNEWFKLSAVQDYVQVSAADKFVWTDDDLAREPRARRFAEETGILAIAPNDVTGLTHSNIRRIEDFLS